MTSALATGSAHAKRSETMKVLWKTSAKSLLFSSNFIMGLCQLNAYMVSSHYISNDWKQYLTNYVKYFGVTSSLPSPSSFGSFSIGNGDVNTTN